MALPKQAKIFSAVLLLTAIVGGAFYMNRHESDALTQSTDDAYVHSDFTMVAPQVSGTISRVLVEDDQAVKPGDLLACIDDRDYVVAVESARAQTANAKANITSIKAHLTHQGAVIRQAHAAITADDAALKLAQANRQRYSNLATDGAGTVQALQQAEAHLSIQMASLEKNQAGLLAARQQVDILKADLEKAEASLDQALAAQAAAELKLSYTQITAPVGGTIGRKSVRVGAFVNAGTLLLAIVPLDDVYITANYRETQLARINIGQSVDISVDAFPGEILKGKVASLGPASGASYSTVPPHNASGNFTKIVQRLPVRIQIDHKQSAASKLKVGMSVTTRIYCDKRDS